jgi:hypothetical protein
MHQLDLERQQGFRHADGTFAAAADTTKGEKLAAAKALRKWGAARLKAAAEASATAEASAAAAGPLHSDDEEEWVTSSGEDEDVSEWEDDAGDSDSDNTGQ